jgi:WD40 repeat protein
VLMDTPAGDTSTVGVPSPPATALARPGSRAVVVGTGTQIAGSALPGIPAVAETVTAVRDSLRDQCVMDERHIIPIIDPDGPQPFLAAINRAAAQAEDVLLLYYIGHGLVSLENELFLATSATTDQEIMLPAEALPFAAVRRALSSSRAQHVVVVLDCCFSGRASGAFGTAVANAFELTNVHGSYLLSATSPTGQALAPEGERYTAFSGALIEFLRRGEPTAPRELTLDDAYDYLERALPAMGAPAPQRRAGGNAGSLVVAVNPQAPEVTQPHPDHSIATLSSPRPRPCPYPGLGAFTAVDARYFYGRERLVNEILGVLGTHGRSGPLAVVGRSGAGKSSLLQAGLLPAIRDGRLDTAVPGSRHWPQVLMTPGEHPMEVLARRLAAGTVPDGLILCVDQFEEVFTACDDGDERRAFIHSLAAAASREGTPRVQVIFGLRADFYDRCLEFQELAVVLDVRQVLVRPMSRDELRSAIEGPADVVGLRLGEGLAGRLLLDLESTGGAGRVVGSALPLLAFALRETWRKSDRQVLTPSNYEATGGIWGAVTKQAEEVYESLGSAQDAAKLLLLRMVQLGDGTDDVRRRINVDDLLAGRRDDEQAAISKALDAYVAARLVAVDDGTAEIAHEALLRAWDRLRHWIEEDRQELLDHQRLAEAAWVWKQSGGPLYAGARLDDASKWLDAGQGQERRSLTSLEREFVRTSIRAARRRRNRRLSLVTTAVVAALLLVVGGIYTVQQRAGNQASQAVQSSVQLAQEADDLRATDPAGAMWLSLTAYNSAHTSQARTALYNSYRTPYPLMLPGRGKGAVVTAVYSPDGRTAAVSWADGSVRLWNVRDPQHPKLSTTVTPGPGSELAYSRDGKLLAVRTARSLQLWTVANGLFLLSSTPVGSTAPRSGRTQWPIAFSPKGNTVATGGADGRVVLWNVSDPRHPVSAESLPALGAAINAVAFRPDGATLAVAGGSWVRLLDVRDPGRPAPWRVLAVRSALSLAFSPDGRLLVAGGAQEQVSVWNAARPGRAVAKTAGFIPYPHGDIDSVAFRPGDNVFVATDTAGQTSIWTYNGSPDHTSAEQDGLPDAAHPDSAAFSPNGRQLVTGDLGGTADIWIVPAPLLPGTLYTRFGSRSQVNQEGTLMLTQALTNAVTSSRPAELWDVADPAHPSLAAVLPSGWVNGGFLPDGRTLFTENSSPDMIRFWNVADPRHPRAEGAIPEASFGSWSSGYGWLLVWDAADSRVQLWDIRDISRPTLDATFGPARQLVPNEDILPLAFFSPDLAGVGDGDVLHLWDLSNPRHPVREGTIKIGPDTSWTYRPANSLLVLGGAGPAALWNLSSARTPIERRDAIDIDPVTGTWMDDHTVAGFTSNNASLALWNIHYPANPAETAVLPLAEGFTSPGSPIKMSLAKRLLAAGIDDVASGSEDTVGLWQIAADYRTLSQYAQVTGDDSAYAFAPDGSFLATNLETQGNGDNAEDELNAFSALPNDHVGIVYPLDADSVYEQLCSLASQASASSSWQKYLPGTFYRPACS